MRATAVAVPVPGTVLVVGRIRRNIVVPGTMVLYKVPGMIPGTCTGVERLEYHCGVFAEECEVELSGGGGGRGG